jgi:hypothetical protein
LLLAKADGLDKIKPELKQEWNEYNGFHDKTGTMMGFFHFGPRTKNEMTDKKPKLLHFSYVGRMRSKKRNKKVNIF